MWGGIEYDPYLGAKWVKTHLQLGFRVLGRTESGYFFIADLVFTAREEHNGP